VKLSTHEYLYKPPTLYRLLIFSIWDKGVTRIIFFILRIIIFLEILDAGARVATVAHLHEFGLLITFCLATQPTQFTCCLKYETGVSNILRWRF
jgi:hypothetical protein